MEKNQINLMLKQIFLQTCMICFGISFINSIVIVITENNGGDLKIDYLYPISIIICSILCGLSVIIFYIQKIPFIAQCVIHFILIVSIVTGLSLLFHWIESLPDFLICYGIVLVLYVLIWLFTYRDSKISTEKINAALEKNRDLD